MPYRTLCRVIAVVVVISVVARWELFSELTSFYTSAPALTSTGLTLITLVLAFIAVVGLWEGNSWGFFAFYAFAILFTIAFGASVLPFVGGVIPKDSQAVTVITLNLAVIIIAAFIHWRSPK